MGPAALPYPTKICIDCCMNNYNISNTNNNIFNINNINNNQTILSMPNASQWKDNKLMSNGKHSKLYI
jgi:hypothetical protein